MTRPPPAVTIRHVRPDDAHAFRELRVEAVRLYPLAFTADLAATERRAAEEWRRQLAASGGEGKDVIFVAVNADHDGAEDEAARPLVGMAGVFTPEQPKLSHVGTVWG